MPVPEHIKRGMRRPIEEHDVYLFRDPESGGRSVLFGGLLLIALGIALPLFSRLGDRG
jgi:hypothetical protein